MQCLTQAQAPSTLPVKTSQILISTSDAVTAANAALPEWVRGRGLSIFATLMFGGLALDQIHENRTV